MMKSMFAIAMAATAIGARPMTTSITRPVAAAEADTATSEFNVNGLRVILRRNTATDVVAANVYLLGGSQQLTAESQGIEGVLFAAAERGSRRFPGARLRQELARTGSVIGIDLAEDWSRYGLKATRSMLDTSWTIFTDRLLAPTLTQADVDLVKGQIGNGLQRVDLDPEA